MQSFLVVEDTPAMLNWLLAALRRALPEAQAFGVTNRTDALAHIEQHGPQLVVLDLGIPEVPNGRDARAKTGMGVLDTLAALPNRPRIVVFSSFPLRDECLQRGADRFVSKSSPGAWRELRQEALGADLGRPQSERRDVMPGRPGVAPRPPSA